MPTPIFLQRIFWGTASLLIPFAMAAEARIDGLWDATVVVNKVEVPFRFEIAHNGSQVQGFFFEGDQKIGSTSGSFANGALKLDYDFLNTTLEATLDGDQLRGTYLNRRPNARPMEFRAHKFTPVPVAAVDPPQVAGNWDMRRTAPDKSKLDVSWKLYIRQSGSSVSGAILKTSGDSGLLTGSWKDGKLVMSHFSGDRPLVFEGTLNPDNTLTITLDHQYPYVAARTTEARAKGIPEPPGPVAFHKRKKDPTERFHFSGPELDGKIVSDADARFQGKVVVLTVGGSWCPNCHDEAPFLVELYKQYHAKGLRDRGGLNFEQDADLTEARPRANIVHQTLRHTISDAGARHSRRGCGRSYLNW